MESICHRIVNRTLVVVTSGWLTLSSAVFLSKCPVIFFSFTYFTQEKRNFQFSEDGHKSSIVWRIFSHFGRLSNGLQQESQLSLKSVARLYEKSHLNRLVIGECRWQSFKAIGIRNWRYLWPPYGIGQAIIFLPCDFYLLLLSSSFFFPRLISAVGDWMSTILPHMVWP